MILLAVVALAQAPSIAPELRRAARDLDTIDCRRTDAISLLPRYGTPNPRPDPQTVARDRAIERVRAAVDRRLHEHPDDPAAWVLSARLGYVVGGCGDWAGSLGPGDTTYEWISPPLDVAPLHAALDRALALSPGYAEAHYWKARLYHVSQPVVRDRELENFTDLDHTIEQAQRATSFDSANAVYRLLWGSALVEAGRESEAMPVLQELDGGRHLLFLILRDFDALPLPSGTVAWPRTAADTAAMPRWASQTMFGALMLSSYIGQSPELQLTHTAPLGRVRSWMVPLTMPELEAHFRGVSPAFRFFPSDTAFAKGIQHLRLDASGGMTPADHLPLDHRSVPTDGLLLVVNDGDRIEQSPVLAGMRAQTLLIVLNYRGSAPADPPDAAALKSDLRKIVVAQEEYYTANRRYGTRLGPRDVNVRLQDGHKVLSIERTADGWTARITNARTKTVCTIFVGDTPLAPATQEGEPVCRVPDGL